MIEIILTVVFLLLLLNYVYFLLNILRGLDKLSENNSRSNPKEFVSVIIPFRNESENILNCLKSLSTQEYPVDKFEVIYVNDSSTDGSLEKLLKADKPENISVISVPEHSLSKAYKKRAVSYGIDNSRGEIIVTTDADCIQNPKWLSSLLSQFTEDTALISGAVKFEPSKSIFGQVQVLEFAGLILAGAGLIGSGKPTICNGANLSFRKSVFHELGGYSDQMHLSSGDDELLMQKIASETKYKVKFCWDKNAVVTTNPNKDLRGFIHQRKRWASKGLFYQNKKLVLLLAMIYLFYLSIPLQIIFSFFISKFFLLTVITFLLTKFSLEYRVISKGKDLLFDGAVLRYFLIVELFQIIYIIVIGVLGAYGNIIWKERVLER